MDDLDEVHRLLDGDLQWRGPGFTLEQRRERLHLHVGLARWDDTGCLYGIRALILKDSGRLIGICLFHPDLWLPRWKAVFWPRLFDQPLSPFDQSYASLELGIGYALSSRHRGRGYAAEAVRAFLDHAFGVLKVGRVFAVTDRANNDSLRLMQRVGMCTARNPDAEVVYPGVVGVIENRQEIGATS
jgi:RimJ/RimL family protein N-acetyltransferase